MGQKSSSLWPRSRISLTWALRNETGIGHNYNHSNNNNNNINNNNGKECILEYRQVRKEVNPVKEPNAGKEADRGRRCERQSQGGRRQREELRGFSPATSSSSASRPGRRRRLRRPRPRSPCDTGDGAVSPATAFGYEIRDVDEFLTSASLESPGNIPMVLSRPCVLYETHTGGTQREVSLPLGMVVNGVLKNKSWLYAQTPHGEEGYVPYSCCLPLGILPAPARPQPCWDTQTDIFPRPVGSKAEAERMRDGTRSECGSRGTATRRRPRRNGDVEGSVDGLYLRASRRPPARHTLLVIGSDYTSPGREAFTVCKGDVVTLVGSRPRDWFWVRNRDGDEGFIPAVVAGHGFL